MIRTLRFAIGGLVAATSLAACSSDVVSPSGTLTPRFSGGSAAAGGGGTTTGGGGTKTSCTNTLAVTATATEALTGNAFSATYVLGACQSQTRVSMTATDLSTGAVVWVSAPDILGTIALWGMPYNLTSYRIDAVARAGLTNAAVATASTVVSTLDVLPCTSFVHETATVGYWGIYPAVWAVTDAQDCGQGGTVRLVITNMTTGNIEREYPVIGLSSFIDFEGSIVSYNTPYRVYAELHSRSGAVIATSTTDITSSPLR